MVLIDDDLNTASVRLFNTPPKRQGRAGACRDAVERLGRRAAFFWEDIRDWLDGSEREWSNLAEIVCSAYERRQALLLRADIRSPAPPP